MKFKKLFILGLSVATLAATTGCSSDSADVVFWHTMGESNMAVLDAMIEDFNEIYPDISVTHAAQGGFDDLKDKVSTAIQGGNEPNLAYCYPDHVASYLTQQVVVDLNTFINDSELGFSAEEQADFIEGFWNEGTVYNSLGDMYSFPFSKSTEAMYYNKTAFEANGWEVPTTWDEMWALCAKIVATPGYEDVTPLGYDSEDNMFITLLQQYGLPYTSSDSSEEKYQFDTPEAVELFTDVQSYYEAGYFTTKALSNDEYTSTQFKNEQVLMTIGSTGGASYNLPDTDGDGDYVFQYGVTTIPQPDMTATGKSYGSYTKTEAVIQQGPSITMFDYGDEVNEKAWLFLQFITNTENSATYAMSTGYSPVRYSSIATDDYQEFMSQGSIQANTLLVAEAQNDWYFTSPAFNGSSNARVQAGYIIEWICLSGMSVSDAFAKALDELK